MENQENNLWYETISLIIIIDKHSPYLSGFLNLSPLKAKKTIY